MGVCKKIKRRADQERNVWELFRMFKNEKKILGLSESTLQNYEDSLKRFMDYMECTDAPIQEIDYDDVLSFTQGLQEEELSVSSINHYLRDIRAFFNWCSKSGYCRKIEVKLVKGQETVKETYSEEELKALLEKPQRDSYCEWRCWAIINWILATGNREKTICNVRMRDINLPDEEIVLKQTKNKKIQIIPMSTELSFVLTQFIRDFRSEADDDAGLTADDLKDSIMSIADPDAKNLEGIKENLKDIFGKDGLGQSDFFKGKTDEELENFWDYLQDNNYNPKQMKWDEKTTKENFEAAQEAKKKTPEESVTFASKFKNAAEDTATDIDTVTDNFQSDMKNIQSAMESVTNGTFQNSDMADLIQQFPELSNASGDLKDNLQDLAMDKGAEAIGKIRDSVKDVTDPKQLAQADKYVQSIMDTMEQD